MFAIFAKEPHPKIIISVEKDEVSEAEWGSRIQT